MLLAGVVVIVTTGCVATSATQLYRPANYSGDPYRISGSFEPWTGLAGQITITVNEREVIKKGLTAFTNVTDLEGEFEGKKVLITVTKVKSLFSSFVRADVFIGAERAASLTINP